MAYDIEDANTAAKIFRRTAEIGFLVSTAFFTPVLFWMATGINFYALLAKAWNNCSYSQEKVSDCLFLYSPYKDHVEKRALKHFIGLILAISFAAVVITASILFSHQPLVLISMVGGSVILGNIIQELFFHEEVSSSRENKSNHMSKFFNVLISTFSVGSVMFIQIAHYVSLGLPGFLPFVLLGAGLAFIVLDVAYYLWSSNDSSTREPIRKKRSIAALYDQAAHSEDFAPRVSYTAERSNGLGQDELPTPTNTPRASHAQDAFPQVENTLSTAKI